MKTYIFDKSKLSDYLLLIIRIWLGYRMITASYSSVTGMLTSEKQRLFFEKWFGDELGFPAPLIMAFLAKGAELLGGALLLPGIFSKPAAGLIFFTMLVATFTANLGENWVIDGGFTVSYCLFALVIIILGAGKYSLDHFFSKGNPFRKSSG